MKTKKPDTIESLRAENLRLRAVIHSLTHPHSGRAVLVETQWFQHVVEINDKKTGEKLGESTLVNLVMCAPQCDERELLSILLPEMRDLFAKMGIAADPEKIHETGSHLPDDTHVAAASSAAKGAGR